MPRSWIKKVNSLAIFAKLALCNIHAWIYESFWPLPFENYFSVFMYKCALYIKRGI